MRTVSPVSVHSAAGALRGRSASRSAGAIGAGRARRAWGAARRTLLALSVGVRLGCRTSDGGELNQVAGP
jgi:hypothetical protein